MVRPLAPKSQAAWNPSVAFVVTQILSCGIAPRTMVQAEALKTINVAERLAGFCRRFYPARPGLFRAIHGATRAGLHALAGGAPARARRQRQAEADRARALARRAERIAEASAAHGRVVRYRNCDFPISRPSRFLQIPK